jgi:hypothetical protein
MYREATQPHAIRRNEMAPLRSGGVERRKTLIGLGDLIAK